jgi:multiple sugar transport system substrate-binding protein
MKKSFKTSLVLLIAGFLFLGCSKPPLDPTKTYLKLSSWGDVKENQILTNLINEFQRTHPNIVVELERVPFQEYMTKFLTQSAGNMAPDVVFISTDNVAELYPRGVLENLDDYVKTSKLFQPKDFYPCLIKRFTMDGHLVAIPRDLAPVCVIYYNQKAFDEAKVAYPKDSWDWSKFLATARAVTKRDAKGNTQRWGFVDDWTIIEPWVYSAGGRWVDDELFPSKYLFNSPGFIKGLQFRMDMVLKDKVAPGPENLAAMGGLGGSDLFQNGQVAMFLSGIWKTPQFRDIKNFKWDVVMVPKGPKGVRQYQTGGSGYGILKSSTHKKEAWELLEYIAGPEGAKQFAQLGLSQPALKAIAESPAFLDEKPPLNKKMLLKAAMAGIDEPRASNWREIRNSMATPLFDKLWEGSISAQEAVSQLSEELKSDPPVRDSTEAKPAAQPTAIPFLF